MLVAVLYFAPFSLFSIRVMGILTPVLFVSSYVGFKPFTNSSLKASGFSTKQIEGSTDIESLLAKQ